ncbi:unnamed protein product [Arctia plantaginis]|uniref:Uncharacterized protein n=1 Tax=Arctia plantaginis TaxID=874455 RepID=A0A8S0ZPD3_ARCPL|nr:unnamed protein product [Arctia plantaginis]
MSELSFKEKEEDVTVIFEAPAEVSSDEPSMSEWSSLESQTVIEKEKKLLFDQGLYSPGSSDICPKYIPQSDSTILRHPYYNYPAVHDPGIKEALLVPEQQIVYSDDGQALYLHLCSEMKLTPVRIFHRKLLDSEISLSYYGVDPTAIRAMAMALQFNKHVHVFNLTDNFLTDDSCFHLSQMLKTNTTLKELNLTGCRIGTSGLINLGDQLAVNRTLVTLNLSRNEIGDEGGVHYAKLISDGVTVQKLNLSKNDLGRQTALAFMEAFEWRDPLTLLDLSWNSFLHVPSTVKMLSSLANSQELQEINLSFNAFEGDRIAGAIYNLLLIPTLTALDLSHNRFQGEAIDIITAGLISAKKLVTFNLSFNPMSPEDAYRTLEKMLRPRVKLQNLLMETVCVDKSFLALVARVSKMKSRKKFKVIYGDVLHNWDVKGPDVRTLLLKRAEYLSTVNKKKHIDILVYFLTLNQKNSAPILPKDLSDRLTEDGIPLSSDYCDQLVEVFPGPRIRKLRSINIPLLCEYINRLYPKKKVPEPEPVPEPVVEVVAPPPSTKVKEKKQKVKFVR